MLPAESAKQLWEAAVRVVRGFKHSSGHPLGFLHEAISEEACCDDCVVVGPDRAVVLAGGVVGTHVPCQGAHAPGAEHLRAHQMLHHLRGLVLIDEAK